MTMSYPLAFSSSDTAFRSSGLIQRSGLLFPFPSTGTHGFRFRLCRFFAKRFPNLLPHLLHWYGSRCLNASSLHCQLQLAPLSACSQALTPKHLELSNAYFNSATFLKVPLSFSFRKGHSVPQIRQTIGDFSRRLAFFLRLRRTISIVNTGWMNPITV